MSAFLMRSQIPRISVMTRYEFKQYLHTTRAVNYENADRLGILMDLEEFGKDATAQDRRALIACFVLTGFSCMNAYEGFHFMSGLALGTAINVAFNYTGTAERFKTIQSIVSGKQ